jgi:glycosyltransferase involved in cell wall biosynthesis
VKILYLSCHEVLEYLELTLFHELGCELFSPGAYVEPQNRGDQNLRPEISGLTYDPQIREQYNRIGAQHPGADGKKYLTKEFVDNFDVIIVMHIPEWIELNWESMKHKRVIWRTIGQSVSGIEQRMKPYRDQGMEIVRYSPREVNIPHFCGQTGFIRFYQDPNIFSPWTGEQRFVINFTQSMEQRGTFCNYHAFESTTRRLPRKLFGPNNDQKGFGMGKVSYPQLLKELQQNRVYFYTGTHPASYTLNFIDAFMAGIPVVAIGPRFGNARIWTDHDLYEIQDLIKDGESGFISNNLNLLERQCSTLLNDSSLAKRIGEAGRREAIRHFGKEMVKSAWKTYLGI